MKFHPMPFGTHQVLTFGALRGIVTCHSLLNHRKNTQVLIQLSFYAPAQDACVKSRDRLDKLKLQSDELDLLDSPVEPEKVVEKIKEIQAELEKKSTEQHPSLKRASEFMTSFCTFADKTSGLVNLLLPQSPEYTVTFGMLFILFKVR